MVLVKQPHLNSGRTEKGVHRAAPGAQDTRDTHSGEDAGGAASRRSPVVPAAAVASDLLVRRRLLLLSL